MSQPGTQSPITLHWFLHQTLCAAVSIFLLGVSSYNRISQTEVQVKTNTVQILKGKHYIQSDCLFKIISRWCSRKLAASVCFDVCQKIERLEGNIPVLPPIVSQTQRRENSTESCGDILQYVAKTCSFGKNTQLSLWLNSFSFLFLYRLHFLSLVSFPRALL